MRKKAITCENVHINIVLTFEFTYENRQYAANIQLTCEMMIFTCVILITEWKSSSTLHPPALATLDCSASGLTIPSTHTLCAFFPVVLLL